MRALCFAALVAALVLMAGCSGTAEVTLAETSPTPERPAIAPTSQAEALGQRITGASSARTPTPAPTPSPTPTPDWSAYAAGVSRARSLVLACVQYSPYEKAVVASWEFSFAGTPNGVPRGVLVRGIGLSDDGRGEWVEARWLVYKEGGRWKLSPQDAPAHRFSAQYCVA